jgi:hypothetical protein
MAGICMYKTAGYKAVILFIVTDCRGIKNKIIYNLLAAETSQRHENCNYNNDNGDGHAKNFIQHQTYI